MIAAVVQMTSGIEVGRNLERAAHWIAEARQTGAEFVALPENFAYLGETDAAPDVATQPLDGDIVRFLRDQAKRHSVWLAGGTFPERIPGNERHFNTALLLNPDGELVAQYRKIHLFDVELADASYRESASIAPGESLALGETPLGKVGLSVCYDLRFPELYRELVAAGARVLLVPSAFTVPTGRDHWEVLLRARAIENQAFVLAAAQFGIHNRTRRSYGRSMIVDPWGVVLASVADGEGLGLARLDLAEQDRIRRQLPALQHRRR